MYSKYLIPQLAARRLGGLAPVPNYATKLVVTGAVLAGVMAGCSSQPAVSRSSVTSCAQFGVGAIRRHVTVTVVPAACQGLSQVEVNVAVGRALRAVAGGVRGKLALTGLLVWIGYLATGVTGLAWAACGLLIPVVGLGITLVFLPPATATATAAARPGNDPPPVRHPPALVVAAHIIAASVTILLAVLAAIGSG